MPPAAELEAAGPEAEAEAEAEAETLPEEEPGVADDEGAVAKVVGT